MIHGTLVLDLSSVLRDFRKPKGLRNTEKTSLEFDEIYVDV